MILMSGNLDIATLLATLVELNAGLLAITVTLVALVPALIEIARVKSPSFLSGEITRRHLSRGLNNLKRTIWLFGFATMLSVVSLMWQNLFLVAIVSGFSFIGLVILIRASHMIATVTISLI